MSTSRTSTLLVPFAVAALLLTGCGGAGDGGEGSGNGAGGPTSTGPRSSAPAAVPSETTGVPTPGAAESSTLVAALAAVDPALATDPTSAVANAVSLCVQLRDGDDATTAVPATFPDVDLDAGQQQAVADAVTTGFCPLDGASASPTPSASTS